MLLVVTEVQMKDFISSQLGTIGKIYDVRRELVLGVKESRTDH